TIVILVIATIDVFVLSKHLATKAERVKEADHASLKKEIYHADQAMKKALSKLSSMVSLDEKIEVERLTRDKEIAIDAEKERLVAIEDRLEQLKAEVERQEDKILQIRKGKEESF